MVHTHHKQLTQNTIINNSHKTQSGQHIMIHNLLTLSHSLILYSSVFTLHACWSFVVAHNWVSHTHHKSTHGRNMSIDSTQHSHHWPSFPIRHVDHHLQMQTLDMLLSNLPLQHPLPVYHHQVPSSSTLTQILQPTEFVCFEILMLYSNFNVNCNC